MQIEPGIQIDRFDGINNAVEPNIIKDTEAQDLLNFRQIQRGWLHGRFGSDAGGFVEGLTGPGHVPATYQSGCVVSIVDGFLLTFSTPLIDTNFVGCYLQLTDGAGSNTTTFYRITYNNTHAVQVAGPWVNGTPDTSTRASIVFLPSEARLLHEYITESGLAGVDKPGVESAENQYLVIFANGDGNGKGAIYVYSQDAGNTPILATPFMSVNGVSTIIVAEDDLIPKGATYRGKAQLPLPKNGRVYVFVVNGTWQVVKDVLFDVALDTIHIDYQLAPTSGSLVLASFKMPPLRSVAKMVTDLGTAATTDWNTGNVMGSPENPIIERADSEVTDLYQDVRDDPLDDLDSPPIVAEEFDVTYYPRYSDLSSPDGVNGIGGPENNWRYFQSDKDVKYRPEGLPKDWQTKSPMCNAPAARWGYRYVYEMEDGSFSNASSDLHIGDSLWSAMKKTASINQALEVHKKFYRTPYAEDANGIFWTTGRTTLAAGLPITTTAVLVDDVTMFTNSGQQFPVFLRNKNNVKQVDVAWCTQVVYGTSTIYLKRNAKHRMLFTSGSYEIGCYFQAGATTSNGPASHGSRTADTLSAAATADGGLALLQAFKALVYDVNHPHCSDDAYITVFHAGNGEKGSWFNGREYQRADHPTTQVAEVNGVAIGPYQYNDDGLTEWTTDCYYNCFSDNPDGAAYGTPQTVFDTSNRLRRFARACVGFTYGESGPRWATMLAGTESIPSIEIIPNIYRTKDQYGDMAYLSPNGGLYAGHLLLQGYYEYEFYRSAAVNQVTPDGGENGGEQCGLYMQFSMPGLGFVEDATIHYYSMRKLLPATRLLWDWQLSHVWPASVIWQSPRVMHRIAGADIPATARNIWIFRTRMSTSPAYSPTDYGLVAVKAVTPGTDFGYLDNVKDDDLDFGDDGAKPDDYEGVRFGLRCRYIQVGGERVFLGNFKELYQPTEPRGQVTTYQNGETGVLNTTDAACVAVDVLTYGIPGIDGGVTAPTFNTNWILPRKLRYLVCLEDENLTNIPQGTQTKRHPVMSIFKEFTPTDAIYPANYESGGGTPYIVVLNLQSIGYNGSIKGLKIYRSHVVAPATKDVGDPWTPWYCIGESLSADEGIFVDSWRGLGMEEEAHITDTVPVVQPADSGVDEAGYTDNDPIEIDDQHGFRWSEPLRPEFIKLTSVIDLGRGDGDKLTGLEMQQSNLIMFKTNSLYRMIFDVNFGDPGMNRLEKISDRLGCVAPCTIYNYQGAIIYLSRHGLILFDGHEPRNIDQKVYPSIMEIARQDDVELCTGIFNPRYSEYWLSANVGAKNGLSSPYMVSVATVENVTALHGALTIDGVTLTPHSWNVQGDTVLVKDQTDYTKNGIYQVRAGDGPSGDWVRMATWTQLESRIINVTRGTVNGGTVWVTNTDSLVNGFMLYHVPIVPTRTAVYQPVLWIFTMGGPELEGFNPNFGVIQITRGTLVYRWQFLDQRIFCLTRGGVIYSSTFWNGTPSLLRVMQEDVQGLYADGGYPTFRGWTSYAEYPVSWLSKQFIRETPQRIKRLRHVRTLFTIPGALIGVFTRYMTLAVLFNGASYEFVKRKTFMDERDEYELKYVGQDNERGRTIELSYYWSHANVTLKAVEIMTKLLRAAS